VAAAASVAVALSLVGGVAATAWQAAVARAERLRAEKRVEDVRRMANAMIMDFHDAIVPLAGSTPARKLVLERAVAFLDRLALDAPGDPALERELVEAYRRLGRVQGFRGSSSLGDHAGAKASFSKALRLLEALIDAGARDDWTRLQHPGVLKDLANAEWSLGEYEAALAHLQIARERIGSVLAERPDDVDALRTAGHVEYMQGDVLRDLGRLSDALEVYRSSLGRFRVLQRRNPPDPSPESRRLLAISLDKLGDALQAAGDLTAAAAHFREAFDLRTALLEQAPDSAEARRDVCTSFMRMGDSFLARKDPGRALALYQQAMEMARRKLVADPQSAQAQRDVAVTSMRIGNALAEQASRERGAAARAAKWREARARFVEAEKVHLAMKERGQWMAPDAPMLARYRAGIDRCDAALRAGR
jgi:non-specific serine/threonine protein kinase/serine/threonine-protein kinase